MYYKQFKNKVIVRLDTGEEIVKTLTDLCNKIEIKAGSITGLGATDKATIGLFSMKTKKYHSKELTGDHEIALLYGNISTMNNKAYLHLHVNLCNSEHKSFGGHLKSAFVSATFEAIIDIIDGEINRKRDDNTGLDLIKL